MALWTVCHHSCTSTVSNIVNMPIGTRIPMSLSRTHRCNDLPLLDLGNAKTSHRLLQLGRQLRPPLLLACIEWPPDVNEDFLHHKKNLVGFRIRIIPVYLSPFLSHLHRLTLEFDLFPLHLSEGADEVAKNLKPCHLLQKLLHLLITGCNTARFHKVGDKFLQKVFFKCDAKVFCTCSILPASTSIFLWSLLALTLGLSPPPSNFLGSAMQCNVC